MYQGKYVSSAPKTPVKRRANPAPESDPKSTETNKNSKLFYTIYGISTLVLFVVILCLMIPLRAWLVDFEAAQPKQKCQEVFQQLFAHPDWASLYTMSGMQDTPFENKDTYAAYMNKAVGNTELTYLETSAGLSGDRKYIVRAGEEKIATFTLTNAADGENAEWQLGKVELLLSRKDSVTVEKLPGQTVYINGIALDSTYTIRTVSTLAEDYLPNGLHGYRMEQQYVSGLLTQPEVTVKDAAGNAVTVVRNEETGFYCVQASSHQSMTDTEKNLAIDAAKAYAKFMIRAVNSTDLGMFFDTNSEIYKALVKSDSYVQSYLKYEFDDPVVTDYYRYADNLFSIRVALNLHVTRTNGTIKDFVAHNTYFFTKNASGKWLVTDMVNVNVQDRVEKVRLTFVHEGSTIASTLVSASAEQLTTPIVPAPEGKVFGGWVKEVVRENGSTSLSVMFMPDDNGMVYLDGNTQLEPMTLYTLFKDAGGEQ